MKSPTPTNREGVIKKLVDYQFEGLTNNDLQTQRDILQAENNDPQSREGVEKILKRLKWVNDCSGKPIVHDKYCQGCVKVAWIADFELDKIISQAQEAGKKEERERIGNIDLAEPGMRHMRLNELHPDIFTPDHINSGEKK